MKQLIMIVAVGVLLTQAVCLAAAKDKGQTANPVPHKSYTFE